MKRTVIVTDADRMVDYELDVEFDVLAASPARGPSYASGGEPAEPASMEINSVKCTAITTWLGDNAVSARPADDKEKSLETKMGDYCLSHYSEEIEREVWELLAREDDCGPDIDDIDD